MERKQRVIIWVRVSTAKQNSQMQINACNKTVAEHEDWEVVDIISEEGISGSKIPAHEREAVRELLARAKRKEYDILLTFMFDRAGRRGTETASLLENINALGIRLWSVKEGEKKLETAADRIVNDVQCEMAAEESRKIAVRVREKHHQMTAAGIYRGGLAPLGYKLVRNGRTGKMDRPLYDLEIDEEKAPIIRALFNLCCCYGYGNHRLSTELFKRGYKDGNGEAFHPSSIGRMLQNTMYMGVQHCKETVSAVNPELQIITPEQFALAQNVRAQHTCGYQQSRNVPLKMKGSNLLSGNIYCAHCGGRMFATNRTAGHYRKGSGKPEYTSVYRCYNRTQHHGKCDGQTTYKREVIDDAVDKALRELLQRMKKANMKQISDNHYKQAIKRIKTAMKQAQKDLDDKKAELDKLLAMITLSMEGKCPFSPEDLKVRIEAVKAEMCKLEAVSQIAETEYQRQDAALLQSLQLSKELVSYAEMYDLATLEEKRAIIAKLVKRVDVGKGTDGEYKVEIEFVVTEEQVMD